MTPANKAWIDKRTRWCSSEAKFLEIGSRDINGSPARRAGCLYIGIDRISGPSVDVQADGHALPFASETFDYTICAEVLEHDTGPWKTAKEIHRVTKRFGLVIVTVPGIGFPRHDFPKDYWRFT